ncbi:MAG: hypothetical protein ACD_46C00570G0003 [uncultured bacterium]|nr:MAG: hypothetical protein ACD_46C00570G0003 [uncultured bacterium]
MSMFRTCLLFIFCLLPISHVFAAQGICARITGSWYGSFTLKEPRDCHLYHGCTHELFIHVSRDDGPIYQAQVRPKVGQPGVFKIRCEEGKITSPSHPDSQIELNCPDTKICLVKFNDAKLTASLLGAGVD